MKQIISAFELLGVAPDADDATIRKAWRALVRTYHPDMAKEDPAGANRRLAEINAAFDVVSACTEADRQRLRRMMAEKRRAEEARRRERAARRQRAEAAYAAERTARAGAAADRRGTTGTKAEASRAVVPHPERPRASAAQSGPTAGPCLDAQAAARLAALAQQAFVMARKICAHHSRSTIQPVYM